MKDAPQFLQSILDSVSTQIAVIDADGRICFVNLSWVRFGQENGCADDFSWLGVNYLQVCKPSGEHADPLGCQAGEGIQRVIRGDEAEFYLEYPCHSPDQKRWFMMRVAPLADLEARYFVISHENITERKLAEERISNLARTDGLTGIPNRRYFDEFYRNEWKRCQRLQQPIAVAMIDVDHFKRFNDTYGHLNGDRCLQQIAGMLSHFARRPTDLSARIGGEEFVLVLGGTSLGQAIRVLEALLSTVRRAQIRLESAEVDAVDTAQVTLSVGVVGGVPQWGQSELQLLQQADSLLYSAKHAGRDRIESAPVEQAREQLEAPASTI